MDCWRYEYLDGGGPWFYPDGTPRSLNDIPSYDYGPGMMYGCDTIYNLDRYMEKYGISTKGMCLVHYKNVSVVDYDNNSGLVVFRAI